MSSFNLMAAMENTAAASVLVDAASSLIASGVSFAENAGRANQTTLAKFARQAMVTSRAYYDANIADEPVMPDFARVVMTWYSGMIMNALHLNQFVVGGKTVRELLSVVGTESLTAPFDSITGALEAFSPADAVKMGFDIGVAGVNKAQQQKAQGRPGAAGIKDVTPAVGLVPTGKLLEVRLQNPENKEATTTVTLLVQMMPYIIPAELATAFINFNHMPSWEQRVMMWNAGELNFFKDLLMQRDLIEKRRQTILKDKNNLFYDFVAQANRKTAASAQNYWRAAASPNTMKHNIANTVMVFDTTTVARAKAETGFDLHRAADRTKYFDATFTMILAVVDPNYQRIKMYFNGIEDAGEFAYDQFKEKKGMDSGDLVRAMGLLQQGRAPKF